MKTARRPLHTPVQLWAGGVSASILSLLAALLPGEGGRLAFFCFLPIFLLQQSHFLVALRDHLAASAEDSGR